MKALCLLAALATMGTAATAGAQLQQIDLPITFDDPMVDYTVQDFGGASTTLRTDPFNVLSMVASTIKPVGAEIWAGTTIGTPSGLASPIPFTLGATTLRARVYSPDTGTVVRLKAEETFDPTRWVATEAVTTVAFGWETLVFDFANATPDSPELNLAYAYNELSISFDYGNEAVDRFFLWDDVAFGNGEGPSVPLLSPGALVGLTAALALAGALSASRGREVRRRGLT